MTTKSKPTTRRTTTSRKTSTARSTPSTAAEDGLADDMAAAEPDMVPEIHTDEDVLHADPEAALPASDAAPVTVEEIAVLPQPELRKKELIDLAVERSGIKKRDAKPAIEAALAVLGEALAEGREMNLVPLGKLKVTRMKKAGNGQIINARVRQPEEDEISLDDPLAQAAE